jgi:hypothetical protein
LVNALEEENDLIAAFRKLRADMRAIMLVYARSSLAAEETARARYGPPTETDANAGVRLAEGTRV